jgi:hypothetical protein
MARLYIGAISLFGVEPLARDIAAYVRANRLSVEDPILAARMLMAMVFAEPMRDAGLGVAEALTDEEATKLIDVAVTLFYAGQGPQLQRRFEACTPLASLASAAGSSVRLPSRPLTCTTRSPVRSTEPKPFRSGDDDHAGPARAHRHTYPRSQRQHEDSHFHERPSFAERVSTATGPVGCPRHPGIATSASGI